jgi:hypothetical protein
MMEDVIPLLVHLEIVTMKLEGVLIIEDRVPH